MGGRGGEGAAVGGDRSRTLVGHLVADSPWIRVVMWWVGAGGLYITGLSIW